jgi:hypothetical protein
VTTVTPTNPIAPTETIELRPNYIIPVVLVVLALPVAIISKWLSLAIALFGLFLTLQTINIRLQFTETDLDVYRSGNMIRRFPFAEWQNWRVFWPNFPVLFYFREVKSIHFLPIIFDATMLKACLEQRCPRQD